MRVFVTAPTPPASTLVRPFTVSIPDSEIDDVKQRLARTRWPDPETVDPLRRGRQGRALRGLGTARDPGQRNPHRPAHPSFLTPTRELRSARVSLGLH